MKTELNSLKDQFRNVVEEARMLLPGLQALFGFQTIAVFNQRFDELALLERNSHLVALTLVIISVALLLTALWFAFPFRERRARFGRHAANASASERHP
jgi:hypothetical protein